MTDNTDPDGELPVQCEATECWGEAEKLMVVSRTSVLTGATERVGMQLCSECLTAARKRAAEVTNTTLYEISVEDIFDED